MHSLERDATFNGWKTTGASFCTASLTCLSGDVGLEPFLLCLLIEEYYAVVKTGQKERVLDFPSLGINFLKDLGLLIVKIPLLCVPENKT